MDGLMDSFFRWIKDTNIVIIWTIIVVIICYG